MPGNRLAFAIRVGGEEHALGALHLLHDFLHMLLGAPIHLPDHQEILVGIDRPILRRQVADMAEAGHDLVVAAEILVDRLGFRGGFDNDKIHDRAA